MNLITNLPGLRDEPLYFPRWHGRRGHRQTNNSARERQSSMHNQPWIMLGPSGTCQSMRIPVKPKQSACGRGRSLRGCYTVREQTAAYLVGRYYPRTLTDTVHFHNVCREHRHEKTPPTKQRQKRIETKGRDLRVGTKTPGSVPQRHHRS